MEEKILIKSEKYNVKKLFKSIATIGVVISIVMAVIFSSVITIDVVKEFNGHTHRNSCYEDSVEAQSADEADGSKPSPTYKKPSYKCEYSNIFLSVMSEIGKNVFYILMKSLIVGVVPFSIIGALIYVWLNSYNLTVSDKRVSGEVLFGKKVDLPIDSVSATSIISLFKGVGVSTSSGRISFLAIKNSAEIHKVINDLLIKRQEEKSKNVAVASAPVTDEADQLKKYKDLLDSGVITQEEFDAKKKQLLGL